MAWAVPSNSATLNSHLILYNHCKELTAAQVNTYFTRGNHSSLNSYLHLWKDRHLSKKDGRESLSTSPWDRKRVGIVLLSILASVRKQEDSVTGHLGEMLDSTASPSAQQAYLRNDNTGEKKEVGKNPTLLGQQQWKRAGCCTNVITEQAFQYMASQCRDLWCWFQQTALKHMLLCLSHLLAAGERENENKQTKNLKKKPNQHQKTQTNPPQNNLPPKQLSSSYSVSEEANEDKGLFL